MSAELRTPPSRRPREIFLAALEKSNAAERAAFLDAACGTDRALRGRLDELLREQGKVGDFLEQPAISATNVVSSAAAMSSSGAPAPRVTERPGDRIDRYKLLQQIGEGGCGVVYMAEQETPVRRRVALKIIKLGMDTRSVIARFEAERQALAMMDHPNIAKVLDAGTTETGRPFFVMELVRGIKITEYCDQNNLATEDRLHLFIQVCQAIQHAHQKGIIHRDIKPSNILVTLHDGIPVPKVIDFGIAKAIEQRLTDKTLFTEFQAFIGTPAYTSPEQAEMSGLDVDTRSDIYSLGVLLYELLTGQTPFNPEQLSQSGLDEMRRIIKEEEPLRPSTRLSTMGMAEAVALSKTRQEKLPVLVDTVRGDLDWIVMKCLEKDRTRRYATANDLASDIQRYILGETVLARPPSTSYRFQKFVRRNRAVVIGGVTMTFVLLLGAIVSGWQAIRATQAKQEQSRLRDAAEKAQQNEATQRQRAETEERAALRRAYNSDMNLVQQALAANNYGRVVDLLNRQRPRSGLPDFRQWEWRYFWGESQSDASLALPTQSDSITGLSISPHGRLLASSDRQGAVKLWDLGTRTEVAVMRQPGAERRFPPPPFVFSADGGRFALAINKTVKVWAVATREIVAEIPFEGNVEAMVFSPDGSKLISSDWDLRIRVWDFERQQLTQRPSPASPRRGPPGRGPMPPKIIFSSDAKLIALAEGGRIRLRDLESGMDRGEVVAFEDGLASLAFSPKGDLLAASSSFRGTDTTIKLFSTETAKEVGRLAGHVSWVPGLTFTPDGRRVVSAGADQTIRIWDVSKLEQLATLRGHLNEVNCVAVTTDGRTIVSGCKDGTIFGWDARPVARKKSYATLGTNRVADVEFFPNGKGVLSVNTPEGGPPFPEGPVTLWDSVALRPIERVSALGNRVRRLLISGDGSRVFAATGGDEDGRRSRGDIKVLDWPTRLVVTNLAGLPWDSYPLGLIDKGHTLITAGGDTIRSWDTSTWEMKAEWRFEGSFFPRSRPVMSGDERFLLLPSASASIDVRNIRTGESQASLPAQIWGVTALASSKDGRFFAGASADGTVNLYDAAAREIADVLRGHLLGVHAVAFSPDGQRLASASAANEAVKLWDVETRHEVATLAGEGSIFETVKFSPDGEIIVAINVQRRAHLWRAPSFKDIAAKEARQPTAIAR